MRILKTLLTNFHRYLLWALVSVLIWAWVFTIITDAPRAKKVSVYYNAPGAEDELLAIELEKAAPDYIKMVKVYPFSHAAFGTDAPEEADIYILSESDLERLIGHIQPIEPAFETDFIKDGVCYGRRVYTASTGEGFAAEYIRYSGKKTPPEGAIPTEAAEGAEQPVEYREDENYYICFNKDSTHTGGLNGSNDDAAILIANEFFNLP